MRQSNKINKPERIGSVDVKKNVTLIKCFICNQIFYSHKVFDSHMKQHQSKINRTTHEEIQRKTMESFRVKKGTNSKTQLSSTIKNNNNKTTIESTTQQSQQIKNKEEGQQESMQIEEAMKQSVLLIKQIETLTTQKNEENQNCKEEKYKMEKVRKIQKTMKETQFYQTILKLQRERQIEQAMLMTNFTTASLINYQQQLNYLNQIVVIDPSLCSERWKNVKSNLINTIKETTIEIHGLVKSDKFIGQNSAQKKENEKVTFCSECCSEIGYGQQYYSLACGHDYHEDCFVQNRNCCQ